MKETANQQILKRETKINGKWKTKIDVSSILQQTYLTLVRTYQIKRNMYSRLYRPNSFH